MPRRTMNENDPLVPGSVSIPFTRKRKPRRSHPISDQSECEIIRRAVRVELMRMGLSLKDELMLL